MKKQLAANMNVAIYYRLSRDDENVVNRKVYKIRGQCLRIMPTHRALPSTPNIAMMDILVLTLNVRISKE